MDTHTIKLGSTNDSIKYNEKYPKKKQIEKKTGYHCFNSQDKNKWNLMLIQHKRTKKCERNLKNLCYKKHENLKKIVVDVGVMHS